MTILFIDYAINSLNFYLKFAFKSLVKKLDFVGFAPKPPPGALSLDPRAPGTHCGLGSKRCFQWRRLVNHCDHTPYSVTCASQLCSNAASSTMATNRNYMYITYCIVFARAGPNHNKHGQEIWRSSYEIGELTGSHKE